MSVSGGLVFHFDQAMANDIKVAEITPNPSSGEYIPDQLIVKFKEGILSTAEKQLNDALGTSVIHTSRQGGFKVIQIPAGRTVPEMVNAYRQQTIVQYAEPNYIRRLTLIPNDTYYSYQWHFAQINMAAAWDLDTTAPLYGGDPSIVVAVIDTGVAYETYGSYQIAPDLAITNFWVNSDEIAGNLIDDDGNGYVDDVNGWDFAYSDAHPNDDQSHGTHVTGTIAQSTNNSIGVAGIAFNTTIMPIKVLDSNGDGTDVWVADGIYYAANNGARIINLSLGGTGSSTTMENAVAYARNHGVVVIAAAGNNGNNVPFYPAAYDAYVIAVGATRYDQARPSYSNYGSYLDIAAPGGDVTVDQTGDGWVDGVLQQTFGVNPTDWGYWFFQGTSMASPHVAGVAALFLAKHPSWTAAQVRNAIESTATDIGTAGRDDYYGWGLLNASAAINSSTALASYSDSGHTTTCENFSDYSTQHTAYMYGTGFTANTQFRIVFWDEVDSTWYNRATVDVTSTSGGELGVAGTNPVAHTFVPGTDTEGNWHCTVYESTYSPTTYSASDTHIIANDTSYTGVYAFTVAATAIPEFPTVIAGFVVSGLCAGIYYYMRKRRLAHA